MVQDLLVGEHFWPHNETAVSHIPVAGDETCASQSDQAWQTQCTVSLQPKKQVNISLNSNFDINLSRARVSLEISVACSITFCQKTQLSSTVMTLLNHFKFEQKFHS
jgi:hypothetical protein